MELLTPFSAKTSGGHNERPSYRDPTQTLRLISEKPQTVTHKLWPERFGDGGVPTAIPRFGRKAVPGPPRLKSVPKQ